VADVDAYRELLAPIEDEARQQAWDRERPWRVATHVGWDGELPVVDLHDLKAGPAKRAVRAVLGRPADVGAAVFVTGRGRHTLGATPVLKKVVEKELRRACTREPDWSFRPQGAARWVWISDRAKAPAAATGGSGLGVLWWFLLLLLLGILGVVGKWLGWGS
jgi:hypothetical protein